MVSTIVSPFKVVLIGPLVLPQVHFLKEDPPPFIGIYLVCYWTILTLVLHALFGRQKHSRALKSSPLSH
jgi:hypothetical protein